MFGKVKAAAFAVSSPTSALWADSEKPIDTDAPSSKRQEARTSPARGPGCALRKHFLAKSTFNRLRPAKLLMRSDNQSGTRRRSASQYAITDCRAAFDPDPIAYYWLALLRTSVFITNRRKRRWGRRQLDPEWPSRRGMAEKMTVS
jgi:hypothetical protein